MIDFVIAPADKKDLEQIHNLEAASFSIPWHKESLAALLSASGRTFCLTARTENILGYVGVMYVLDEGEITNIAVHPSYRGQGIGFALLCAAKERCRQLGIHTLHLEVRAGNVHAIALYTKCGFSESGLRRGYYADNGEDAVLFSCKDM